MNPELKEPVTNGLKLRYDKLLSIFAYNLNLRLYSTEIPHGLKLDIINFNFFKIIMVRRVFLHVTFMPPGMECHIFIDPFDFKIAGTTILSLTGLEGDKKKASKAEGFIENKHLTQVVFRRTESARLCEVLHSPLWYQFIHHAPISVGVLVMNDLPARPSKPRR